MMRRRIKGFTFVLVVLIAACVHAPYSITDKTGYPADVGKIIVSKCAVSGCHNDASYIASAGLNLSTWEHMFKGSRSGSVVIPYSPDFSSFCYFTNIDTSLGVVLKPTMPVGERPLSVAEYATLKNWIAAGAPDDKGNVSFENDPVRKKLYVTNRLCNVVTVLDRESLLPMRYVGVGGSDGARYPYCVKVSPDKKHWYVSFFSITGIIQKFSAETDKLAGEVNIGSGSWTSFAITADSKYGYFVDNSSIGKIAYVDLEHMQLLTTYTFSNSFRYPSGIVINEDLYKIYVGTSSGNFIYKINISDPLNPVISELPIDGSGVVEHNSSLDPVELLLEPGKTECYVACLGSSEIRRIDMLHDTTWQAIPLGSPPAYLDYSVSIQKLFVSCPDDMASFPGNRGSVSVIDVSDGTVIKKINSGYQPYGIAVDDEKGLAMVVNANISSAGPASHHVSRCGEKNGNISFIELNTLSLKNVKRELSVFPNSISIR